MNLYHGTYIDFNNIDLSKSRPNKDFGKGFYLSADLKQAERLAQFKSRLEHTQPIIQCYEFDESVLMSNEMKTLHFLDYTEEWAQFVLDNRSNPNPESVHDYDIVIGPIADDKVGFQLLRYLRQDIDIDTMIRNLKFMRGMTIQYFFGTQRAINLLHRI